jgi:hypothetical protein
MIIEMFGLGVLFGAILLFIGSKQESFPMVYLSMFVFLILGLILMSDGLSIVTGSTMVGHTSSNVYTIHTTLNDPLVNIFAWTFFLIPLAGILLSTLYTLRR